MSLLTDEQIEAGYAKLAKQADEIGIRQDLYDELLTLARYAANKASHFDGAVLEEVRVLAKRLEVVATEIRDKAEEEVRRAWDDSDQYNRDLHAFEASFAERDE